MIIRSRTIVIGLVVILLVLAGIAILQPAFTTWINANIPFPPESERILSFGRETSLSSWFGSAVYLLSGLLLIGLALRDQGSRARWFWIQIALMVLLAIDQTTSLHDRLIALAASLDVNGWLLLALCLGALTVNYRSSRFLPARIRVLFNISWASIMVGYSLHVAYRYGFVVTSVMPALLIIVGAIVLFSTCLSWFVEVIPHLELRFKSSRRLVVRLLVVSLVFSFLTIVLYILEGTTLITRFDPFGFIYLVDTGQEATISTLYSSALLLFAALLLGLISRGRAHLHDAHVWHWRGLALIFVLLSIDEAVSLHEQLMQPSRALLSKLALHDLDGFLYFAWVVPIGVLLVLFTIAYISFLRRLPRHILILFFISAAIFVGGAAGFEFLSGYFTKHFGNSNGIKLGLEVFEESFEMLGEVAFIYSLLEYLRGYIGSITVIFSHEPSEVPHQPGGTSAPTED